MTDEAIKAELQRIRANIRVTKVVATRAVKGKGGDSYAGFSASWNTVQDDSGGGIESLFDDATEARGGMTLKEARVAHLMVAMQADLAAYDAAWAGGNISASLRDEAHRGIKANYNKMIREAFNPTQQKTTDTDNPLNAK